MADVAMGDRWDEAPVSLYFDLENGRSVDLEVAARTSIAFAEAIKEIGYILDPSAEIRVELVSGTPGSLSIDSFIKVIKKFSHKTIKIKTKDGTEEEKEVLKLLSATAVGVALWMGSQFAEHTAQSVFDHLSGKDEYAHLSDADKADIAARVAGALEKKVARPQIQQVYREAERDTAIRGIGVSSGAGKRPKEIVPRSDFSRRAGRAPVEVEMTLRRVIPETVRVTLISPVLVPGDRKWKLRSAQGEFGATLRDKDFVERVLTGTTRIPMVAGIEMDVELETTEDFTDGVWVPVERNVQHVVKLYRPPTQGLLPLPPPEYGDPN